MKRDYDLHFRWNDIAQVEEYQHDLLKTVVRAQEGTPAGADALVALLRSSEWTPSEDEWIPLFKVVIEIVCSRHWQPLKDIRLMRIEGEAYETWWCLSRAHPDDPALVDNRLRPDDFLPGADQARLKAIAAYRRVLALKDDGDLRRRVTMLRGRADTGQRTWYRSGD